MTIDELKVYLSTLTWEEFERLQASNERFTVMSLVSEEDKDHAVFLFFKWFNENRNDGGYTEVVWGNK